MKWWLWRPNDIRGPCGPKVSWHLCYRWGKIPKRNLTQETCPDRGSNPGHAKTLQENAQELTSVAHGWATHSPWQCLPAHCRCYNKKLRIYGWEVLPHVLYSSDMSPPDFDLFPKLKEPMHGRCFSSLEELSTNGTRTIRHMNKSGVLDGIIMLPKRWDSVRSRETILKDCEQIISKK